MSTKYLNTVAGVCSANASTAFLNATDSTPPQEFYVLKTIAAADLIAASTASSSTGVSLLADSEVPSGYKVVPWLVVLQATGAAFTGATTIKVSDTNGASAVDFLTVTVATLVSTNPPIVFPNAEAVTGTTCYNSLPALGTFNTSGVAGKGLCIRGYHASATALAAGSAVNVHIRGYFVPA